MSENAQIYIKYLIGIGYKEAASQFKIAIETGDRKIALRLLEAFTGAYVRGVEYATEKAAFGPSTKDTYTRVSSVAKHKSGSAITAHNAGRKAAYGK